MIEVKRRLLLRGLVAMPAIVAIERIMPVKLFKTDIATFTLGYSTSFTIGSGTARGLVVGMPPGADLTPESKAYCESQGLTEIAPGVFAKVLEEGEPAVFPKIKDDPQS